MNIISIFSGRKFNIEILKKYLQKALDLDIIDEVHFLSFYNVIMHHQNF